ncbi:hypothetical protein N7532_010819 [Penicillium argentinense]|uniref:Uncharacterized protein n=1 Tax=Penicillium argentinense TaxID=1131581 RepID=A0A9W9EQA2_9EURO|nr:uncharacterized protein N7532_010819 [Penicillium argentinense]KAJ5086048.1 hypothetical protein N7532_010819 [Penicillium argentinense]
METSYPIPFPGSVYGRRGPVRDFRFSGRVVPYPCPCPFHSESLQPSTQRHSFWNCSTALLVVAKVHPPHALPRLSALGSGTATTLPTAFVRSAPDGRPPSRLQPPVAASLRAFKQILLPVSIASDRPALLVSESLIGTLHGTSQRGQTLTCTLEPRQGPWALQRVVEQMHATGNAERLHVEPSPWHPPPAASQA